MENYICINGKKAELTEEQMKALGIESPKANSFKRLSKTKPFYFITNKGKVELGVEVQDFHCEQLYGAANYCTDKAIMEQRALHETLNRLLWRYSMEHDGDKINWSDKHSEKYSVYFNYDNNKFEIDVNYKWRTDGAVHFDGLVTAHNAIEEIIKPFIKAHPEFKF